MYLLSGREEQKNVVYSAETVLFRLAVDTADLCPTVSTVLAGFLPR
jgi:hypothetical protein